MRTVYNKICGDAELGFLYLDLSFHRPGEDKPFLRNDFVIQVRRDHHETVMTRNGPQRLGCYWTEEQVIERVQQVIDRYLKRAEAKEFTGDHRVGHGGILYVKGKPVHQGWSRQRRLIPNDLHGIAPVIRKHAERELRAVA